MTDQEPPVGTAVNVTAWRLQAREFARYFIVCVLALLFDMATLAALTELAGWHYLLANVVAFVIGATLAYLGSVLWAFSSRRIEHASLEYVLFAAVGVGGLLVNSGCLWLFTEIGGVYYLVSKVGAGGFSFMFNFLVRKFLLFR